MDLASELFSKKVKFLLVTAGLLLFFGVKAEARAASLYFSPASGTYSAGQTFSVSVFVSSTDQAMNAASGSITVSSETIVVTGVSKGGIVSFWPKEPSFSAGSARFDAVITNGYTGGGGKILTLSLRALKTGTGTIRLSSGSVLAHDGKGTNITSGLGSATFTIKEPEPSLPPAPTISSPSHPDSTIWYPTNNITFIWTLPSGIDGISYVADGDPKTEPDTTPEPMAAQASLEDAQNGVGFFHIRFKNKKGWGSASHFPYNIDTLPPEPFTITFPQGSETYCPRPDIFFETKDLQSGMDHYEVSVDEEDPITVGNEVLSEKNPFLGPAGKFGDHTVTVTAVDKAGNERAVSGEYSVQEPEEPLIAPVTTTLICPNYTPILAILLGIIFILLIGLLNLGYRYMKLKRKLLAHIEGEKIAEEILEKGNVHISMESPQAAVASQVTPIPSSAPVDPAPSAPPSPPAPPPPPPAPSQPTTPPPANPPSPPVAPVLVQPAPEPPLHPQNPPDVINLPPPGTLP